MQKSKNTKKRMKIDTEGVLDYTVRTALQLQKLQRLDRYSQRPYPGLQTLLQLPLMWTIHLLLTLVLIRVQIQVMICLFRGPRLLTCSNE